MGHTHPSCRASNVNTPSAFRSPLLADGCTTRLPPVPSGPRRLLGRLAHVEAPFLLTCVVGCEPFDVFTFVRISAACGMNVADIFHQQRRLWVRAGGTDRGAPKPRQRLEDGADAGQASRHVGSTFRTRRSSARARDKRDITVPISVPMTSAMSLYESPSISRSTRTSR